MTASPHDALRPLESRRHVAATLIAFLICLPSMIGRIIARALARGLPSWLQPNSIVLGLDLQGGAHLLYEVDRADVVRTHGRQSARRPAPPAARGEDRHHRRHRRQRARRAGPHPRRRRARAHHAEACTAWCSCRAGAGGSRPRYFRRRRRPAQAHASPTPRSTTRSSAPSSRRSKSSAAASTASARPSRTSSARARPHPRRGAGPAGHQSLEGHSRHHRQARIPPRRRTRRQSRRRRHARPDRPARQIAGRKAGHGAGRGSHRRPARLRFAHRRAGRQFPLQHSRRPEIRPGDLGQCRAALRHRARQQGDFGAAHPRPDHRRLGPDFRPFHRRAGQ